MKSVDYSQLLMLTISSVQTLKEEVDALKKANEELKAQLKK